MPRKFTLSAKAASMRQMGCAGAKARFCLRESSVHAFLGRPTAALLLAPQTNIPAQSAGISSVQIDHVGLRCRKNCETTSASAQTQNNTRYSTAARRSPPINTTLFQISEIVGMET